MINRWYEHLQMAHHDFAWYVQDIADELVEYHEETNWFTRWSELSDVIYTYTRSTWDNCKVPFPLKNYQYYVGIIYMIPKYSLRWYFYRRAGRRAGASHELYEVRNPKKVHKLHYIAKQYGINPQKIPRYMRKTADILAVATPIRQQ